VFLSEDVKSFVLFINKAISSKMSIYTPTKRNRSEKSNEIGGY
jgi:hypothetical protein